jgi:gentisate 1,2-dioxygenase
MEAVQKTPEREAFYKKIDGENLSALWNVMGDRRAPASLTCGNSTPSATI